MGHPMYTDVYMMRHVQDFILNAWGEHEESTERRRLAGNRKRQGISWREACLYYADDFGAIDRHPGDKCVYPADLQEGFWPPLRAIPPQTEGIKRIQRAQSKASKARWRLWRAIEQLHTKKGGD